MLLTFFFISFSFHSCLVKILRRCYKTVKSIKCIIIASFCSHTANKQPVIQQHMRSVYSRMCCMRTNLTKRSPFSFHFSSHSFSLPLPHCRRQIEGRQNFQTDIRSNFALISLFPLFHRLSCWWRASNKKRQCFSFPPITFQSNQIFNTIDSDSVYSIALWLAGLTLKCRPLPLYANTKWISRI